MAPTEVQQFIHVWNHEAAKTVRLLEALPAGEYDFRPDPDGRSLGELAWHLAEADAYVPYGIELGGIQPGTRPPGIERPRTVEALAPGYARLHEEAVARIARLAPADLDRTIRFFHLEQVPIRDLLWNYVLFHGIHHRAQLALLCRLAGARPVGMYGPVREEMPRPAGARA